MADLEWDKPYTYSKAKVKKMVREHIVPVLIEDGFKQVKDPDPDGLYFSKAVEGISIILNFGFGINSPRVGLGSPCIRFDEVEKIVEQFYQGNRLYTEFQQQRTFYIPDPDFRYQMIQNNIYCDENQDIAIEQIKSYLLNRGLERIKYYSYLPNMMEYINGDPFRFRGTIAKRLSMPWDGLVPTVGIGIYRVLITSRLCNDPEYEVKKQVCIDGLKYDYAEYPSEEGLEGIERLDKAIEVLDNIQPKYNL